MTSQLEQAQVINLDQFRPVGTQLVIFGNDEYSINGRLIGENARCQALSIRQSLGNLKEGQKSRMLSTIRQSVLAASDIPEGVLNTMSSDQIVALAVAACRR